jgi:hypothetical protein
MALSHTLRLPTRPPRFTNWKTSREKFWRCQSVGLMTDWQRREPRKNLIDDFLKHGPNVVFYQFQNVLSEFCRNSPASPASSTSLASSTATRTTRLKHQTFGFRVFNFLNLIHKFTADISWHDPIITGSIKLRATSTSGLNFSPILSRGAVWTCLESVS